MLFPGILRSIPYQVDEDGSGEIEFGEFCQLCATFLVEDPDIETMKKELKDAFRFDSGRRMMWGRRKERGKGWRCGGWWVPACPGCMTRRARASSPRTPSENSSVRLNHYYSLD